MSTRRLLRDAWHTFSRRSAAYQSTALLSLIYYLVLGPSALVARAFGKRLLDLEFTERSTYWLERSTENRSLADLRRPF